MADLLIVHADWLLTLDRERRIIRDGAVAVEKGAIAAVGKTGEVAAAHRAPRTISARGMVVTPGRKQAISLRTHVSVRGRPR